MSLNQIVFKYLVNTDSESETIIQDNWNKLSDKLKKNIDVLYLAAHNNISLTNAEYILLLKNIKKSLLISSDESHIKEFIEKIKKKMKII